MKPTVNFVQDCMCWLTEISVYTNRIHKMQLQMQAIKPKITEATKENFVLMMQRIDICSRKINITERRIIHVIKQQTNSYIPPAEKKFSIESEDELFDEMKYAYNLFIEMQRTFNYYLKEYRLPQTVAIEVPASLKPHHDKIMRLVLKKHFI